MDEVGASRIRSGVVLTVMMTNSNDPGRILFRCSAKVLHPMES